MTTDSKPAPSPAGDPVIQVRDVWKIFGDRADEALTAIKQSNLSKADVLEQFEAVVGVREVSFDVHESEIFCIMGLSGSGKSTLVRHINRLIEPTHGEIRVGGVDVGGLNASELRLLRADRIGMVFQNMALLPHRTVRDNIAFALELRNVDAFTRMQLADKVIETVSLQGYGDRMPAELSGGTRGNRDPASRRLRRGFCSGHLATEAGICTHRHGVAGRVHPGRWQRCGQRQLAFSVH